MLTQSSIRDLLTCPKRFWYRYIQRIDPEKFPLFLPKPGAMVLGQLVHEGIARVYGKPAEVIRVPTDYEREVELARAIVDSFTYVHEVENYLQVKPLAIEVSLGVEEKHFKVAGKLDMIAEWNGEAWVIEHKTSGKELNPYSERYHLGYQNKLYFSLARVHGYPVRGVLINHIWTYLYRRKEETHEAYANRLRETMAVQWQRYFRTLPIEYDTDTVKETFENCARFTRLVSFFEEQGYPQNPDACNEYKRPCPYSQICMKRFDLESMNHEYQVHHELGEVRWKKF